MIRWLKPIGWLVCIAYSNVPSFWLMVHPYAERWRRRKQSPYLILLPAWVAMWAIIGAITARWRTVALYSTPWSWLPGVGLFAGGLWLYSESSKRFSAEQLGGIPEVSAGHREQRLVTSGIRSRVRHPVYLAHLCEMLAWSLGTGLLVCYALTGLAVLTGLVMIRTEDRELELRFGDEYRQYRQQVPAILPRIKTQKILQ